MSVHRVSLRLKRLVPTRLFSYVRRAGNALLTPFLWSWQTGHLRSALADLPVDKHGAPLPWYTMPCQLFLEPKDFTGKSVLEFGAGHSTLWWAKRADRVLSFEDNPGWFLMLKSKVPSNVELRLHPDRIVPPMTGQFDVIVIDGMNRQHCARMVPDLLAENGVLIIDNSEGYGFDSYTSISEFFRDRGFKRVDFYGYYPGLVSQGCTSILYRGDTFVISGQEVPVRLTELVS